MTRPKVLIVEDEGLVALTMEDLLTDLGCEVVGSFGSVQATLAFLATNPDLDGALLAQWIAFNALYGQWDGVKRQSLPDRESWRQFLDRPHKDHRQ